MAVSREKLIRTPIDRPLSRRNLIKGLGIGALGATGFGLHSSTAQAHNQASVQAAGLLGLERLTVGDVDITVIKDASLELEAAAFGGGAPEGAVGELLGTYNLPSESVTASINVLLLSSGGELTLIDAGNGSNLLPSLKAIGVSPAAVTTVILTHWHPDHINGVSADGALNFPNAAHHFPRRDWNFLQASAAQDETIQGALDKIQPAEEVGVLELYESDQELVPGLTTLAALGHTPGHHALRLSSGGDELMLMADTANHPVVALQHPEWSFGFDNDPEQATATRRELYGRAADEGVQVFAYHFGFPGFGYVARDGDGFRFTADL